MPDVSPRGSTPSFEKVLWKTQLHPDNYIPPDFLSSLRKNRTSHVTWLPSQLADHHAANFRPYTYWSLVSLSCAVTQHLSTICIFISVFVYLKEQLLDPRTLIWLSVGCFVVGYTLWVSLDPTHVVSHERVDSCLYPARWFEFDQVLKLYWNSSQNF